MLDRRHTGGIQEFQRCALQRQVRVLQRDGMAHLCGNVLVRFPGGSGPGASQFRRCPLHFFSGKPFLPGPGARRIRCLPLPGCTGDFDHLRCKLGDRHPFRHPQPRIPRPAASGARRTLFNQFADRAKKISFKTFGYLRVFLYLQSLWP